MRHKASDSDEGMVMTSKDAYTTKELLVLLRVKEVSSITRRAEREGWHSRKRQGRGGVNEWLASTMPESTRLAIHDAEMQSALVAAEAPVDLRRKYGPAICDDKRRGNALAKSDLLTQYISWQRQHGFTRASKEQFIRLYESGYWAKLKKELGTVSWKTLERWKNEQKEAGTVLALADKRGITCKGKSMLTEQHRTIILGQILNPNGYSISTAAREAMLRCKAEGIYVPSEPTIRRFAKAFAAECYDEWVLWREGKKAWNDKCAISILRDWNLVEVGDVIIADGHTLNFETVAPETGKAKRMTLVLFFDGRSNMPLGWEVMATENVDCISSAFRRSCMYLGKFPRVIYMDNGRAFRARYFEGCDDFEQAGFLGLYRELGCEIVHAWPYHGQSKTVERFFGSMHDMEVRMPSYTGRDIASKPARMKRGEELHRKLYEKLGGRPLTLAETHAQIARWFEEYASRPQTRTHLGGKTPAEVFNAGRGPGLSEGDIESLNKFMMRAEIRTITKDGIRFRGRLFWHECFSNRRHPVIIRYDDYLSPYDILVCMPDGTPLCWAKDREAYGIACGIHPMARVLGTPEQQKALAEEIGRKRLQEKESSAGMRAMYEGIIKPETEARIAALRLEESEPRPRAKVIPLAPKVTAEEAAAIEAAKEEARAAHAAPLTYTPSGEKPWRDELERYTYLFGIRYEQGLPLVSEDAAWMTAFEETPIYERNFKRRFDALRELYERRGGRAATA